MLIALLVLFVVAGKERLFLCATVKLSRCLFEYLCGKLWSS